MPQPTYTTAGGFESNAIYSGAVAPAVAQSGNLAGIVGSDVMLQAGNGRLNRVVPHQGVFTLSGPQLTIYDAALPVSGGPLPASGHIPLAVLPGPYGVSGQVQPAGTPIVLDLPFSSGLCLNSRSGQPGYTITWSAEKANR